jgi:hypothetical protein
MLNQINKSYDHDTTDSPDSGDDRFGASLALQSRLGVLSERRFGTRVGHYPDPVSARHHLKTRQDFMLSSPNETVQRNQIHIADSREKSVGAM